MQPSRTSGLFFYLLTTAALTFALALLVQPWWVRRRRKRVRARPFPASWRSILQHNVPYASRLPAELQLQLEQHIQVFLAEKPFLGCAGLEVTDEMRVTVAAHACLLLLERGDDYFPALRQILLYPGPFVVDRTQSEGAGVLRNLRQVLSGESWSQGQVILSWQDVLANAQRPEAGHNVVIHEFAHQLDQQTGAANGAPELGSQQAYARWSAVLGHAFEQLQRRVQQRDQEPDLEQQRDRQQDQAQQQAPSVLDDYAATNPAEFFAVASEVFFLRPQQLAQEQPELHAELRRFYAVDPLSWCPSAATCPPGPSSG